jgi:hypothetical protein
MAMKTRTTLLAAGLIVLVASTGTRIPKAEPFVCERPEAIGVWAVPEDQVRQANAHFPETGYCLPAWPFRYDGRYVTLKLFTLHAWPWHSEDNYYRLQSRWQ